jgi:hypothetical protein
MICWRSSPPPRHPPVSSGPLAHPRIPSQLPAPVTRRFPLLRGLHRCRHLHLRSHPLGKVDVSARTWSQNQQVSCMYCTVSADPYLPILFHSHLVHASDADQAHALLTRWGPEGQGKLGGPFQISFDGALFSPPHRRPTMGKPNQEYDPAE